MSTTNPVDWENWGGFLLLCVIYSSLLGFYMLSRVQGNTSGLVSFLFSCTRTSQRIGV